MSSPFFINIILPFLLIFVVVFAILQKTRILGEGKKQIDAIVALVIGLIVISFGYATGVIVSLIPFLAVSAIIILVFLILYSMVFQGDDFKINKPVQVALGILITIGVVVSVLVATGFWEVLIDMIFYSGDNSALLANVVIFVTIIVAVAVAVLPGGKSNKKDDC